MSSINREKLKNKNRIVIKVGSSSLTHPKTGRLDLYKLETLVRELSNLRNAGKDVILVSSGAIMVGMQAINLERRPHVVSRVQACASIGQARLMMIYQKLFSEYSQLCSQILLTKSILLEETSRRNAQNTFEELLDMGAIPVVNENDTISTYEIHFGDNDTLSAVVAALTNADLLILLSDIDGMFTDDPNVNPDAKFISEVKSLDDELLGMAKGSASGVGTGGMVTKLKAGAIATSCGCDMVIASASDFANIHKVVTGEEIGTLFLANPQQEFDLLDYLKS